MSERIGTAIRRGAAALLAAGVDDPAGDAERLMRWATGHDGAALAARRDDPLGEAGAAFEAAIRRRAGREPLSHITGQRLFWGRAFAVTPDVLDPRPESEIIIAAALAGARPKRVLDLGVGSGCLLGTILAECPEAVGFGVDASPAALRVAARNMDVLGVAARATLQEGDWLGGVSGRYDLILCNPPYIRASEMAGLSPEVAGHEPHMALTPGGDGLQPYRQIAPTLADVMAPAGRALFEVGPEQGDEVAEIFARSDWPEPIFHRDFDGRRRCLEFVLR